MLPKLGYTALLLGVLILVHELGHFLVAKACGVKVLKFSIGFGPRIFGFTWKGTEYRLAWIPLGGYVKMAGELPGEEVPPEELKHSFLGQPPWKRALIVAAGPVFNLVFPILVYFAVFVGSHQTVSTRIGSVEPGLPAAAAQLRPGDRILAVDGEKVQTFEELRSALQPRYDKEISLSVERDGQTFSARLTPAKNVETNPLESVPRGMIGISPYGRPPLLGVPPGSTAAQAGLATFDRVLSVNGHPVQDETALWKVLDETTGELALTVRRDSPAQLPGTQAKVPSVVSVTLQKQPGDGYAALGAERADLYVGQVVAGSPADKAGIVPGDRIVGVNGQALKSFLLFSLATNQLKDAPFTLTWSSGGKERTAQVRQAPTETKDELGQSSSSFDFGLRPYPQSPSESLEPERITRHYSPVEAALASMKIVPEIIGKTAVVLYRLVTLDVPFSNVGGPIMLYQIASKSAEAGWEMFLNSMAVISVNLGLMNLLPIPILDGFQLLAAIWEGVRRRPIPTRAREIANLVGLAMLLVLMVLVFKNDITR